jgi:hypothetical protein
MVTSHQVVNPLAVILGVGLEGYLTGKSSAPVTTITSKDSDGTESEVTNPAYEAWSLIDQKVLRFLVSSMGKESLSQVRACRTAAETWAVIAGNFMSATRAHTVNSRIALTTTKKGDLSIVDYINKMHILGDELAAAGKPLDDDDLVSYILTGLNFEYNLVITTLIAEENLTLFEVYSQLLSFEQHLELQRSAEHYANVASHGRGNTRGKGPGRGGRGPPRGRGGRSGRHGRSSPPRPNNKPKCQLCG